MKDCHSDFRVSRLVSGEDYFSLFFCALLLTLPFFFLLVLPGPAPLVVLIGYLSLLPCWPVWGGITRAGIAALKRVRRVRISEAGIQCDSLLGKHHFRWSDLRYQDKDTTVKLWNPNTVILLTNELSGYDHLKEQVRAYSNSAD